MPQKIRVGRSENLFFFFFFFLESQIDVKIKAYIESRFFLLINEVIDSSLGLELKLFGISFTSYCANTGQIPYAFL